MTKEEAVLKFEIDKEIKRLIKIIIEENLYKITEIITSKLETDDGNIESELKKFILKTIPAFLRKYPEYAPSSVKLCLLELKNNPNLNFMYETIIPTLEKSLDIILKHY